MLLFVVIKNNKAVEIYAIRYKNHETMELLLLNKKAINFLKYMFSIETYAGR